VGGAVGGEGGHQRGDHHPVAVEVVARDERAQRQDGDEDEGDEHGRQADDLGDDRMATFTDRPAVGERSPELLLEREEEPGGEGERGEPQ
jgi:hypothetical protein